MKGNRLKTGPKRHLAVGALALGMTLWASMAMGADKLGMAVIPRFVNGGPEGGYSVELSNSGPDAKGTFTIHSDQLATVYPVDLPRGAKQEFTAYALRSNPYSSISCELNTDQGSQVFPVEPNYEEAARVLIIGADVGSAAFLQGDSARASGPVASASYVTRHGRMVRVANKGVPTYRDCYVKPEWAPGDYRAYRNLSAVILANGAERISDQTVAALRDYVLCGGELIFMGGTSPVFRDKRWEGIFPLNGTSIQSQTVNLKVPALPAFTSQLAVETGQPAQGTDQGANGITRRYFGIGVAVAVPFNLLDAPLKGWAGREAYVTAHIIQDRGRSMMRNLVDPSQGDQGWSGFGGSSRAFASTGAMGAGGMGVSGAGTTAPEEDPFSFQPPAVGSIALLIGAYLVLVAPVNFLVLRKLRRSEWAWFTTPVISVVFAGGLLTLASKLYLGKMVTANSGVILAYEGAPDGMFSGESRMFFPSGGTYDLKLRNVQWLAPLDVYSSMMRAREETTVYDEGQLVIPAFTVTNLQFRQFNIVQKLDTARWLSYQVTGSQRQTVVRVTNHSPYAIKGATLYAEGGVAPVLQLGAGQTVTITVPKPLTKPARLGGPFGMGRPGVDSDQNVSEYATFSRTIHRPILEATIIGPKVGPQLGKEDEQRTNITLVSVGATSTEAGAGGEGL